MKAQKKYSIFYIVVDELEGFEWFIKHMPHTDTKVFNLLIIYACMFKNT
jgi:hypothetical protein